MSVRRIAACAAVAALLAPLAAEACNTKDLQGTWRYFETAARLDGHETAQGAELHNCWIRFDARGRIIRDLTFCERWHNYTENWNALIIKWYGGSGRINGNCAVALEWGELVQRGQMTPDKKMIVGQGLDQDRDALTQFQMVKSDRLSARTGR